MMDFNERVIPGVSANFLYQEALARYVFAAKNLESFHLKVLDLACGTGYGSKYLSDHGHHVTGLDVNHEAIAYANKHYGKQVSFLVGDCLKIPFPDQTFDAVCAFEIIEHLGETKKFLVEIKRVLKKNGIVILSTPNGFVENDYHVLGFNAQSLSSILRESFSDVQIYGQYQSPQARQAHKLFMQSQATRETFVQTDKLRIRKLIPKEIKEFIWRYLGNLFGRQNQEVLKTTDFPVRPITTKPNYLVAVCRK
jgi:ubiquinone/menaquinone biosynthesis C-methylase UbiE